MSEFSAGAFVGFTLLLAFLIGGWVGGGGLHDPDTCWLLGLGKWIFEHQALPQTDPFSYTFAEVSKGNGMPFVMYQWLAELIFFICYKIGGLKTLLAFSGAIVVLSFISLPVCNARRRGAPQVCAMALVTIGIVAASFHFLVRPEITSYICIASLFYLFAEMRATPFHWRCPVGAGLLLWLWANMHSGFTLGILCLIVFACVSVLQALLLSKGSTDAAVKSQYRDTAKAGVIALFFAVPATCLTPWGLKLWQYMPLLLFPDFNKYITELKPLGIAELREWTFYPFLFLSVLANWMAIKRAIQMFKDRVAVMSETGLLSSDLFSLICIPIITYYGYIYRRMIPFAVLIYFFEIAFLLRKRMSLEEIIALRSDASALPASANSPNTNPWAVFSHKADLKLENILKPVRPVWPLILVLTSALGTFAVTGKAMPPQLPQTSGAFHAPKQAIEFVSQNSQPGGILSGRMFNDGQYGDMMIWQLEPCPPVFIDTRWDMYGRNMIADYQAVLTSKPNWPEVMRKWDVSWIFIPKHWKFNETVAKSPDWHSVYSDEDAVIYVRSHGHDTGSPDAGKIDRQGTIK